MLFDFLHQLLSSLEEGYSLYVPSLKQKSLIARSFFSLQNGSVSSLFPSLRIPWAGLDQDGHLVNVP